jgi:hypothetical protein
MSRLILGHGGQLLAEFNMIKQKLLRKPNTNYFNEDNNQESHNEYYSRVFSRTIIERKPIIIVNTQVKSTIFFEYNYFPLNIINRKKNNVQELILDEDNLQDDYSDSDESSDYNEIKTNNFINDSNDYNRNEEIIKKEDSEIDEPIYEDSCYEDDYEDSYYGSD